MKIVICGSMAFAKDMLNAKQLLEKRGYDVVIPEGTEDYCGGELNRLAKGWGTVEGAKRKIDKDLIRKHYREIKSGDAILVVNKSKNGIEDYIGGNSLLEMGFAYVLNKKIYVLNDIPKNLPIFYQELVAMRPISLCGDLSKIKEGGAQ